MVDGEVVDTFLADAIGDSIITRDRLAFSTLHSVCLSLTCLTGFTHGQQLEFIVEERLMASKVKSIADEASQLERHERVEIIEKLLESLESGDREDPADNEIAWKAEVLRRSQDLKTGEVTAISWNQVRAEGERLFDGD